jgi:hypothetical protein
MSIPRYTPASGCGRKAIPPKRRTVAAALYAGTSLNKRWTVTCMWGAIEGNLILEFLFSKPAIPLRVAGLLILKKEFRKNENKKPDRTAYGSSNVPLPVYRLRQQQ